MNRRLFFREGIRELLVPVAGAVDKLAEVARQISQLEDSALSAPPPVSMPCWLRPPGAVTESLFRTMCSRCNNCVAVCPVQCIRIDLTGTKGDGVAYIDPEEVPCRLCENLSCMSSCPTGALVVTAKDQIRMGTAQWYEDTCLRRQGDPCMLCVDHCPVGGAAIALVEGRIQVSAGGCAGCGVCQHDCPTYPKSIRVVPRAA